MRRRGRATDWHGQGTVLLVEDEDPVRRYASLLLTELGFTVLAAADGTAALDLFRTHKDQVVLVLLDVSLPGLGGDAVAAELKSEGAAVPVVLCSGYDARTIRQRFAGYGVAGFLAKPYSLDQMRTTLRGIVP
jgi:CheY-like chemotaxis protein